MTDIHTLDIAIFIVYFLAMLGVGMYFYFKNQNEEDYFAGGRSMGAGHIGLSVVATDVGGGFSISLGGLGFVMGLSGSWMLFTGLVGTWLSAVWLIPKIYPIAHKHRFLTFPQVLKHHYGPGVAVVAGLISFIGYTGFTSAQIMAGAKLAKATFPAFSQSSIILMMGALAVLYTSFGGIKAVIYTDTIQWIILILGLALIGIPIGFAAVGGIDGIMNSVRPEMLSLSNVSITQLINWAVTIIPIWFVAMTLYQRIYAAKDQKTAIRAWKIAGFFEWPVMAFMGVTLGLLAKVALDQGMFDHLPGAEESLLADEEMGLPVFLRTVLPVGMMGLMMSAYFSAIMSTADSCLMAASGNFVTDILERIRNGKKAPMWVSQLTTLLVGMFAVFIALQMSNVLDVMLQSYAFMVSGLLVPVLAMIILKKPSRDAALLSMIAGGGTTLLLNAIHFEWIKGLDNIIYGLTISALFYIATYQVQKQDNDTSGITN